MENGDDSNAYFVPYFVIIIIIITTATTTINIHKLLLFTYIIN